MKTNAFLILFLIAPLIIFGQERFLSTSSKDSINGSPRLRGSLGANLKLNGYYDFYGGLQDSETFNVGLINVFEDDDAHAFHMDMYQSQISIKGELVQKNGKKIRTEIEFDFWGGNGHMRLRKAYVETKNWQIGQNWNNFGDEAIWPNIMEWEGPPSGIWIRSPHIKYMNTFNNENWIYELSLEAPITDYIRFPELEPLVGEEYQTTPDLTYAVKNKHDWGHVRLAGILRNINYKFDDESDSFTGYGFALSGIYKTEKKNNLQFQFVAGKGITAYMTSIAGLGYDGYPTIDADFNATPSFGGWISYEYYFTPKFHSNVVLGFNNYWFDDMHRYLLDEGLENNTLVFNGDMYNKHTYGILNFMYEPFERMTIGLEMDYGVKKIDANGTANGEYFDNNRERDALRMSFGFMFYL